MSITFAAARAHTLDIFATAHDDTLIYEYDVDALAAQIEHLVNNEDGQLDIMTGAEFWAIAEPYRW
jgi:hypothetical protein